MNLKLILTGFLLISQNIFCQCDSVVFSSDKIGLYAYTRNIDSIKYFSDDYEKPSPFGPSSREFSPHINCFDTGKLEIKIKDASERCVITFIWNSVIPGAYKFDWWVYTPTLPSGIYYIEKNSDGIINTHKIVIIR